MQTTAARLTPILADLRIKLWSLFETVLFRARVDPTTMLATDPDLPGILRDLQDSAMVLQTLVASNEIGGVVSRDAVRARGQKLKDVAYSERLPPLPADSPYRTGVRHR